MPAVKAYTSSGESKGSVDLPQDVFGRKPSEHLSYEAVKSYLADQRLGLASTKRRSEVRGGGKKPFRQKGTGRARQGTRRSPLMPGGGVTFGPHPRTYRVGLPKKVRREALLAALTAKAHEGAVSLIEQPVLSDEVKTKRVAILLAALGMSGKRCLLVLRKSDEGLRRASRNIPSLWVVEAQSLTPYPLIWAEQVILCEGAVEKIRESICR